MQGVQTVAPVSGTVNRIRLGRAGVARSCGTHALQLPTGLWLAASLCVSCTAPDWASAELPISAYAEATTITACKPKTSCISTSSFMSPSQYLSPWTFNPSSTSIAFRQVTVHVGI
eukprot:jgi/Chrzof1/9750/Cz04g14140.t1